MAGERPPQFHIIRHPEGLKLWYWELRGGNGIVLARALKPLVSKQATEKAVIKVFEACRKRIVAGPTR